MRIGLFTDTYPPFINGVSTSVLMLKQGLEKLGHEVYVVTVNDESFSYKEEDGILKIPSFPIGLMNFRQTGIYPIKAFNIIKKWKLDIIHSHTEFSIGTFARLISKQLNIPLVHTYHTMYEEYIYYITKGYFNSASKKLVEYLTLFLCDKTIDELIVPTEKTKELFKDKYKVKRDVYVIPSGIDTTRFYKENIDKNEIINLKKDLGLKRTDFIVLYVGRIAKEKSIDFLINNFNSVLNRIPKAKMIIVGDGPDIKDLIDLTRKKGLENKIIFTGKAPWTDVPKYYSLCDLFVTASKTETQGLTVMEAMGASKPVVAIRDESFELMITDKKDGLFFDDEKSYVDMIYEVYKNKKLRDEISFNARLTADKYSPYNYAKNVLKVYDKVISKDTNVVKKVVHNVKKIFTKSGGKK
ncbi:glycosyl transferase group 1 [Clostridium sp. CAG:594]|nr:glycosyl transferase group 1 [Clostridium sp. CAG:594]